MQKVKARRARLPASPGRASHRHLFEPFTSSRLTHFGQKGCGAELTVEKIELLCIERLSAHVFLLLLHSRVVSSRQSPSTTAAPASLLLRASLLRISYQPTALISSMFSTSSDTFNTLFLLAAAAQEAGCAYCPAGTHQLF